MSTPSPAVPDSPGEPSDAPAPNSQPATTDSLHALAAELELHPEDCARVDRFVQAAAPDRLEVVLPTLKRMIEASPRGLAPRYGLVLLAFARDDEATAREQAKNVFRIDPNHEPTAELFQPEVVAGVLEELKLEREIGLRLRAIDERVKAKQFEGVLPDLDRILFEHPKYPGTYALFLKVCAQTKDVAQADRLLQLLDAEDIRKAYVLVEAAKTLNQLGQTERALPYLVRAVAVSPTSEEAIRLIQRLLTARPDLRSYLTDLAQYYQASAVNPAVLEGLLNLQPPSPSGPPATAIAPGVAQPSTLEHARELELVGQAGAAVRAYQQWATSNPGYESYLHAAVAAERLGQLNYAQNLYNHALHFRPQDPVATDGLRRAKNVTAPQPVKPPPDEANAPTTAPSAPQRVEDVELFDPDPNVVLARAAQIIADPSLSRALLIAVVLRKRSIGGDLAWLPQAATRDVTLILWLYGRITLAEVEAAGVSPPVANNIAAQLAVIEQRWADAVTFPVTGDPILSVIVAYNGKAPEPLAPLPPLDQAVTELFASDHLALPKLRRITANMLSPALMATAQQAWDEAESGLLEDAAFHYRVAGQSSEAGAPIAKCNEAVLLARLGRDREAFNTFSELYRRDPGDSHVVMGYALTGIRISQVEVAEDILNKALQKQENWKHRLMLAALAAKEGRCREGFDLLTERKGAIWENKLGATFALRLAEAAGPAALDEAVNELTAIRTRKITASIARAMNPPGTLEPQQKQPVPPPSPPAPPVLFDTSQELTRKQLESVVQILKRQKNREEVLALLRGYVKDHPNYPPARLFFARELRDAGKTRDAVAEYRKSVQLSKPNQSGEARVELTEMLLALGQITEAIKEVEKFSPAQMRVADHVSRSSLAVAEQVANADPTQKGREQLIKFMKAMGVPSSRIDEQVGELHVRQPVRPTKPDAKAPQPAVPTGPLDMDNLLAQWRRMVKTSRPDRALVLVLAHLAKRPGNPELERLHARSLVELGREGEARDLLLARIEQGGERDDRLLLAEVCARLNSPDEELRQYEALLEENPFDSDAHRFLTERGLQDRLLVAVPDVSLLMDCEAVYREGSRGSALLSQERLRKRILEDGPTPTNIQIADVLATTQPGVPSWKRLVEVFSREAAKATADEPVQRSSPRSAVAPQRPQPPGRHSPPTPPPASAEPDFRAAWQARRTEWENHFEGRPAEACFANIPALCKRVGQLMPQNTRPAKMDRATAARTIEGLIAAAREEAASEPDPRARTELLVEVGWVYRMSAQLIPSGPEKSREQEKRHEKLARVFNRALLHDFFRTLADLPLQQALVPCLEIVSLSPEILPRWWKDLRGYLQHLSQLADKIQALSDTLNMNRRREWAQEAARLCSDLVRHHFRHIDPSTLDAIRVVIRKWQNEIDSEEQKMAPLAPLTVRLGEPEAAGENTFDVRLTLANDSSLATHDLTVDFKATPGVGYDDPPTVIEPTGQAELRLRISNVAPSRRAIELRGKIRYKMAEAFDDERVIATVLTPPWVQPSAPFDHMPYLAGPSVSPSDSCYVERQELIARIKAGLRPGSQANVILLHGLRRVGKSTLLKHLLKHPPENDLPYFVDLQQLPRAGASAAGVPQVPQGALTGVFLHRLGEHIVDAVRKCGGTFPPLNLADWKELPTHKFGELLEATRPLLGNRRVLFLIDEFEELIKMMADGSVEMTTLGFLRSIMQHQPQLAFVIVGANQVINMITAHSTPFFNLMMPIPVAFLSPAEAEQLIIRAPAGKIEYDKSAVAELTRVSGGHPFLLQDLCRTVVEQLSGRPTGARPRDYVTLLDVEQAVDETAGVANHGVFNSVWSEIGLDDKSKLILTVIAESKSGSTSARHLSQRLKELEWPIDDSEVFEIITQLTTMNLAGYQMRADRSFDYRVAIPLFAAWLRRHRSAPDLVRAMLTRSGTTEPELFPEFEDLEELDDDLA